MTTQARSDPRLHKSGNDPRLGLVLSAEGGRLCEVLRDAGVRPRVVASSARELATTVSVMDVVLLDATRAVAPLPEVIRSAIDVLGDMPLIVIVSTLNHAETLRALRAGAAGIVVLAELRATLAASLNAVRSGMVCIPRCVRRAVESERLSLREKQVLGMVVRGATNADIAAKLFLAESTVKSHLASAYAKLGVRTRKEAAAMILDPTEGLGPGILSIAAA